MRRTKAFTLVELMVVIGIIGLLLAILVPALNKARETANRAVCMSNLGSINKALLVYKSENDNQYPLAVQRDHVLGQDGSRQELRQEPLQGRGFQEHGAFGYDAHVHDRPFGPERGYVPLPQRQGLRQG